MGDIDKIVKQRIMTTVYWKRECYGINAATICDRASELKAVGGLHANQRPTDFLCLVCKLVLISPPREIIEEMLNQKYFKYLTALAAVYIRLCYDAVTVHKLLEPKLADYRKLRLLSRQGAPQLWHIDELIEALLTTMRCFDLTLPRMPSRQRLEDLGLDPREPLTG